MSTMKSAAVLPPASTLILAPGPQPDVVLLAILKPPLKLIEPVAIWRPIREAQ
jgi:hypothetical protein